MAKVDGIELKIKLTDTDLFKQLAELLATILRDEDIPTAVRFKYFAELEAIMEVANANKNRESDK